MKHFRHLSRNKVNWLVPAKVQSMLSGCKYAQQDRSGSITLTYLDDTTETRAATRDLLTEFDGFMSVVGYVQAARNT